MSDEELINNTNETNRFDLYKFFIYHDTFSLFVQSIQSQAFCFQAKASSTNMYSTQNYLQSNLQIDDKKDDISKKFFFYKLGNDTDN